MVVIVVLSIDGLWKRHLWDMLLMTLAGYVRGYFIKLDVGNVRNDP